MNSKEISKEIRKEIKSLDIKKSKNHDRILILLYILQDMNRTKNQCLFNLCRDVNEAIEVWKSENNWADTIRNSLGL